METFFTSEYFWLGLIVFLIGVLLFDSFRHRRAEARPKRRTGVTVEQPAHTFDPARARTVKKKR